MTFSFANCIIKPLVSPSPRYRAGNITASASTSMTPPGIACVTRENTSVVPPIATSDKIRIQVATLKRSRRRRYVQRKGMLARKVPLT